jgi:hypothetical protein
VNRARVLLSHLYDVYKAESSTPDMAAPKAPLMTTSIVMDAIQNLTPSQQQAAVTEIEAFFSGTYPCLDGDVLKWWKVNCACACLVVIADNGLPSRYIQLTSRYSPTSPVIF